MGKIKPELADDALFHAKRVRRIIEMVIDDLYSSGDRTLPYPADDNDEVEAKSHIDLAIGGLEQARGLLNDDVIQFLSGE
jgi:hypothetical protein